MLAVTRPHGPGAIPLPPRPMRKLPVLLAAYAVLSGCHVAANCKETTVRAVHFGQRLDYVVDLSDGHSYQRDPNGTESWTRGGMKRFSVGDTAYVCTDMSGYPHNELDVVDSPHEFDYSGHFIFHRIR